MRYCPLEERNTPPSRRCSEWELHCARKRNNPMKYISVRIARAVLALVLIGHALIHLGSIRGGMQGPDGRTGWSGASWLLDRFLDASIIWAIGSPLRGRHRGTGRGWPAPRPGLGQGRASLRPGRGGRVPAWDSFQLRPKARVNRW